MKRRSGNDPSARPTSGRPSPRNRTIHRLPRRAARRPAMSRSSTNPAKSGIEQADDMAQFVLHDGQQVDLVDGRGINGLQLPAAAVNLEARIILRRGVDEPTVAVGGGVDINVALRNGRAAARCRADCRRRNARPACRRPGWRWRRPPANVGWRLPRWAAIRLGSAARRPLAAAAWSAAVQGGHLQLSGLPLCHRGQRARTCRDET